MICKHCSAENPDDAKFCHGCGRPLSDPSAPQTVSDDRDAADALSASGDNTEAGTEAEVCPENAVNKPAKEAVDFHALFDRAVDKVKALPKLYRYGAAALLLTLIVLVIVLAVSGKKINLNKFLTVEATGYNGYGEVTAEIDWDGLEKKYGKKIVFTKQAIKDLNLLLQFVSPEEALEECVDISFDESRHLSNGQTVNYSFDIDPVIESCLKCKLKYKDGSFTVADLEDPGTVDLFDMLDISFEGMSTIGSFSISVKNDLLEYFPFSVDKRTDTGLSNGDTLTVSFEPRENDYFIEKLGALPVSLEKQYKVEGLEEPGSFDPFEDLMVSFDGYSGYGRLYSDYSGTQYGTYDFSFSAKDGLTNGDVITVTLPEYEASYFVYNFGELPTVTSKDYTVEGLAEVGSFDPFDGLSVTFSGIAPDGRVSLDYTGDVLSYYDFSCDHTRDLSNGDTVTVSIEDLGDAYYVESCGAVPESLEKSFEVSGLQDYAVSLSDLPEAFIDELKAQAEDTIYAYAAGEYDDSAVSELTFEGYVLNSVKDTDAYFNKYNDLYLIFSGIVTNSENDFPPTVVRFPVDFYNVMITNGEASYEDCSGIAGKSYFNEKYLYWTYGYTNPLTAYSELCEANLDKCNVECGGGFEIFSDYEAIDELADIDAAYIEELSADAVDQIESYIASVYSEASKAENLSYEGAYLLISKSQGTKFSENNTLYLIFSADVSNSDNRFADTKVYFPVMYKGIVHLPTGEFITTVSDGLQGHSYFENSTYYTDGYIDGEKMFSDLVTSNREKYTYEVSDGLKEFGE